MAASEYIQPLRKYLFSMGLILLVSGCASSKPQRVLRTLKESSLRKQDPKHDANNQRPTITIWVHGTKGTARMLPIKSIKKFFDCQMGLNHWTVTSKDHHHYDMISSLIEADSTRFVHENCYLFGWSGLLSFAAREQAAEELYANLCVLLDTYYAGNGTYPGIRIITHSHGGNVTLMLPEVMAANDRSFIIDELILLACPVQDRTAHLVAHPIFQKVYALYSAGDLIQIGDPQGAYRGIRKPKSFFSRRHFDPAANVLHAMITFNGRAIMHVEFVLHRFLRLLPSMLDELETLRGEVEQSGKSPHAVDFVLNIKK